MIHKLGSGGLATVWLCRDSVAEMYVAVKIVIADESHENCIDLELIQLASAANGEPGYHQLGLLLTHFWLDGPNGHHLCIVLPVHGPKVDRSWHIFDDPGTMLRKSL